MKGHAGRQASSVIDALMNIPALATSPSSRRGRKMWYRSVVKAMHRLATLADAGRLFELRRQAIVTLAPKGMSVAEADAWAATLTVEGMERKVRELEIWVAQVNGAVVGWGAIHGGRLEGLYTDPAFIGRGVGTELLGLLEALIQARGISAITAEASANAEEFYRRRGYEQVGLRTPEGAQPMRKRLS
jgi:putative acetyltransferase